MAASVNATATSRSEAPAVTPAPVAEAAPFEADVKVAEAAIAAPAAPAAPAPSEGNASDILAMIRSRQSQ